MFIEEDDGLSKTGIIRTIYDPTAGTGGFLSSGMEYVRELNPQDILEAFHPYYQTTTLGDVFNPDLIFDLSGR